MEIIKKKKDEHMIKELNKNQLRRLLKEAKTKKYIYTHYDDVEDEKKMEVIELPDPLPDPQKLHDIIGRKIIGLSKEEHEAWPMTGYKNLPNGGIYIKGISSDDRQRWWVRIEPTTKENIQKIKDAGEEKKNRELRNKNKEYNRKELVKQEIIKYKDLFDEIKNLSKLKPPKRTGDNEITAYFKDHKEAVQQYKNLVAKYNLKMEETSVSDSLVARVGRTGSLYLFHHLRQYDPHREYDTIIHLIFE